MKQIEEVESNPMPFLDYLQKILHLHFYLFSLLLYFFSLLSHSHFYLFSFFFFFTAMCHF